MIPAGRSRTYRIVFAFFLAVACVIIAFSLYDDITEYEAGNSPLWMNNILMIVYDCIGKWGVIVVWSLIAPLAIWLMCFASAREDTEF